MFCPRYLPIKLLGGKDNGSGKTTEQLFRELCPHSKGLPTILNNEIVSSENLLKKVVK